MNRNGNHALNKQHVDWNVELRRIERQFDGLPPEPSASVVKARKEREQRLREQVERRVAMISGGARLLLVASLVVALQWWPYGASCGPSLAGFLAAVSLVAVGGLWAGWYSWRHRLAIHHVLAMLLVVTGLALVAAQVLPRLGYATVVGVEATSWTCSVSSPPGATS